MELTDYFQILIQHGGTAIMAILFIWVFVTDKTKNNKLLENNTKMLDALTKSNKNIAKSLNIISNNLVKIDKKINLVREEKENERKIKKVD